MIKKLNKFFKRNSGQSLAEFAVITAMMATFIATASAKLSDLMEGGKVRKTEEEMVGPVAIELRRKYPALQKAWNKYLTVWHLINGND